MARRKKWRVHLEQRTFGDWYWELYCGWDLMASATETTRDDALRAATAWKERFTAVEPKEPEDIYLG